MSQQQSPGHRQRRQDTQSQQPHARAAKSSVTDSPEICVHEQFKKHGLRECQTAMENRKEAYFSSDSTDSESMVSPMAFSMGFTCELYVKTQVF